MHDRYQLPQIPMLPTVLLTSLLVCAATFVVPGRASAQFGDIINKAKKKAQDKMNQAVNSKSTSSTSAGTPGSATASASETDPQAASSSGLVNYNYCSLQLGPTKYFSQIFTVPIPSRGASPSPTITNALPEQFRQFLIQKYQDHHATRGSGGCEAGWSSEQTAKEEKTADAEHFEKLNTPGSKIVETDWVWSPVSADQASRDVLMAGPPGYAFCYVEVIDRQTSTTTYYTSNIFQVHLKEPSASQQIYYESFYRTYRAPYEQFVQQKYSVRLNVRGTANDCNSRPTEAAARQEMAQETGGNPKLHVINTGWLPDGNSTATSNSSQDAGQGESNARSSTESSQLAPDIRAAIQREQPLAKSYCDKSMSLTNYYDCACVTQQVLAARSTGATHYAKAAGETLVLEPQLGVLVTEIDLRSCVAPDKITAYATKRISEIFSISADRRSSVSACTSNKLIGQMKADMQAIKKEDSFFNRDLTTCNTGR